MAELLRLSITKMILKLIITSTTTTTATAATSTTTTRFVQSFSKLASS